VAVIVSNALQLLVSKFAVTLTATICSKKSRYISFREIGERGKEKVVVAQFCSTRIVVYGFLQQEEDVANVLAEQELLFQHPEETEFDRRVKVKYINPHYLLAGLDKTSKRKPVTNILVLISMLRLICNHGEALLSESALKAWRDQDQNSLTWEMLETSIKRGVSCDCKIEELDAFSSAVEELIIRSKK
jgi:hypothetical protein